MIVYYVIFKILLLKMKGILFIEENKNHAMHYMADRSKHYLRQPLTSFATRTTHMETYATRFTRQGSLHRGHLRVWSS